ncbi:IPT/TIG domain-containing protein [Aquimarina sp. AU119]|uniref:IPT/TIG domain-containing protein n=1 Tax=Aquimarina sp. AU119 TaxID=2108528 RepID=UPI00135BE11F|nr:IPT/TIG domain-containing protein [Aquimarina sp. AU119]
MEKKTTITNVTISSISPTEGSLIGNNLITLTGTGFNSINNPAVNFGNAGATKIKIVSDTIMTMVNPNTGVPGSVSVTLIDGGTPIIAPKKFNYNLPEITGIHPSASSVQGGETITIEGKFFTGASAVNFKALGATQIHVLSDNKITVTNPIAPNAETVDVQVVVQGNNSPKVNAAQFTYHQAANNGVPLLFSSETPRDTYIQFIGDQSMDGKYYDNSGTLKSLAPNTAYSLQEITSGTRFGDGLPNGVPAVLIKTFSGRIYISMGGPITGMSANYTPDANKNPNLDLRYQYFEPTIKDSQMDVDLSYIDFTAISLSLNTFNAPHATNKNQISSSSFDMATATGAVASTKNGSVLPKPADQLPNAAFARVISPQLGNDGLYHDFTNYLKTVLVNKKVRIAGTYVGTGHQPSGTPSTQAQSYDYTASFDTQGNVTLVPNTDSGNGYAPGVPTVQQGPGVGTTGGNIVITFDDLNDKTGIYGCNSPYTLGSNPKTTGITNDVYGQVVGDLLAGLNFGYVGSTAKSNNVPIGSLSSTEWWGGIMPDGTVISFSSTPGGNNIYFDGAQSDSKNYNSYAGSISLLTSGYGFPLQDRLGHNLLTMNTASDPNAYLVVWVDILPTPA